MPWSVKKIENKYCVVKKGETEPIEGGCHDSQDDASNHVRALYAGEAEYAIKYALFTEEELRFCDMEQFNEDHDEHGKWVPKPGLPAAHSEMMAGLANSLKHISNMIYKAHFEEAPMAVAAPQTYKTYEEYVSELIASGKEIIEHSWEGPVAFEGVFTGDKRYFHPGSLEWNAESFPVPFRWQRSSIPGHTGAVPIGRVDHLERKEDGTIYGYGVVIPSLNEEAAEYLRLLESGVASGVSVDGDSAVFDVRELADGTSSVEFTSLRIRSLTAVDIPAFNEAQVDLTPEGEDTEELARKKRKKGMRWVYSLTAAACAPVKPPVEWFEDPALEESSPITVTPEGKVFGHLALFDSCHIGFPGSCVSPPKNGTYKYFHTGEIETDGGDLVEVGHLTFNTGHAAMNDNAKNAAVHYDNTGTVAADVRVGEDKHGIWVAGALRSHLADEDVRAFRAAPLSGDWRRIAGRLELVAALAVNVPGFPVPRTRSLVASGETETLITFQEAELVARQDKKAELGIKVEEFFNENHSESDGKFTSGSGGGSGSKGGSKGKGESGKKKASGGSRAVNAVLGITLLVAGYIQLNQALKDIKRGGFSNSDNIELSTSEMDDDKFDTVELADTEKGGRTLKDVVADLSDAEVAEAITAVDSIIEDEDLPEAAMKQLKELRTALNARSSSKKKDELAAKIVAL